MILGVDFDNTLVCYDGLFYAEARKRGLLPEDAPRDKDGVRRWLIERGQEDAFTLLQGEVYGPGLRSAQPYPGALECLSRLKAAGHKVYIVSHKTQTPAQGPAHDLRQAGWRWLETQGFYTPGVFARGEIFFEDTMAAKAARIGELGCAYFVDDMDRFLTRPDFPTGTTKLWFCPAPRESTVTKGMRSFSSWRELAVFFDQVER